MFTTKYISNEDHYATVLKSALNAKSDLWIGTADIKDLYIKTFNKAEPFLAQLAHLISNRVNVRLIHAKEPGPRFRKDFDRFPVLIKSLERMLCPRVHFKIVIIDFKQVYIGSANLTGAGIGMKSKDKRNFEAGIFTNEKSLIESAIQQFDEVWMGGKCGTCQRRKFCSDCVI